MSKIVPIGDGRVLFKDAPEKKPPKVARILSAGDGKLVLLSEGHGPRVRQEGRSVALMAAPGPFPSHRKATAEDGLLLPRQGYDFADPEVARTFGNELRRQVDALDAGPDVEEASRWLAENPTPHAWEIAAFRCRGVSGQDLLFGASWDAVLNLDDPTAQVIHSVWNGINLADIPFNEQQHARGPLGRFIDMPDQISRTMRYLVGRDPAARKVASTLLPHGDVFVVGGAPRDIVLNRSPKDIDMMARIPGPEIEKALGAVEGGKLDFTGRDFGVFRFKYGGSEVEIALPRTEVSTGEGHKDFLVKTDPTLSVEEDLIRRDFTANAIAVNLRTGEVIDPYGGIEDLQRGRLKVVSDTSFHDDPLRIIRGLVARSRHGLIPDVRTLGMMHTEAANITNLPAERIQPELDKLISGDHAPEAIRLAHDSGVLKHFLPEVDQAFGFDQKNPHHNYDLGTHLLEVLRGTSGQSPDVRLAALFHDIGKPKSQWIDENGVGHYYRPSPAVTAFVGEGQGLDHQEVGADMARAIMRRLKYSNARTDKVETLVRHHMFPAFSTSAGARKFVNKVGPENIDDLLALRRADRQGKGDDVDFDPVAGLRQILDNVKTDPVSTNMLAVNGNDVMKELGIGPSKEVGRILRGLLEAVLDDPSLNERQALIDHARQLHSGAINFSDIPFVEAEHPRGGLKNRGEFKKKFKLKPFKFLRSVTDESERQLTGPVEYARIGHPSSEQLHAVQEHLGQDAWDFLDHKMNQREAVKAINAMQVGERLRSDPEIRRLHALWAAQLRWSGGGDSVAATDMWGDLSLQFEAPYRWWQSPNGWANDDPKLVDKLKHDPGTFAEIVAQTMVLHWAQTANDDSPLAWMIQRAAENEFGLDSPYYMESGAPTAPKKESRDWADKNFKKWPESEVLIRKVLRAQYDITQERLAKEGIKEVVLYRGMSDVAPPLDLATVRSPVKFHDSWVTIASRYHKYDLSGPITVERSAFAAVVLGDPKHFSLWTAAVGGKKLPEKIENNSTVRPLESDGRTAHPVDAYAAKSAQVVEVRNAAGKKMWIPASWGNGSQSLEAIENKVPFTHVGDTPVPLAPLSSWSDSFGEAERFGGSAISGAMLAATVPAARIHSLSTTGFGAFNEREVVLLGGTDVVFVAPGETVRDVKSVAIEVATALYNKKYPHGFTPELSEDFEHLHPRVHGGKFGNKFLPKLSHVLHTAPEWETSFPGDKGPSGREYLGHLIEGLRSWQGWPSNQIGDVMTGYPRSYGNMRPGNFGGTALSYRNSRAQAEAVVQAVATAPRQKKVLWRGSQQRLPEKGEVINLHPSSFSGTRSIANRFGNRPLMERTKNNTSVLFKLESGAHALRFTDNDVLSPEDEYIAGGDFEVVSVSVKGSRPEVVLRQIRNIPEVGPDGAVVQPSVNAMLAPIARLPNFDKYGEEWTAGWIERNSKNLSPEQKAKLRVRFANNPTIVAALSEVDRPKPEPELPPPVTEITPGTVFEQIEALKKKIPVYVPDPMRPSRPAPLPTQEFIDEYLRNGPGWDDDPKKREEAASYWTERIGFSWILSLRADGDPQAQGDLRGLGVSASSMDIASKTLAENQRPTEGPGRWLITADVAAGKHPLKPDVPVDFEAQANKNQTMTVREKLAEMMEEFPEGLQEDPSQSELYNAMDQWHIGRPMDGGKWKLVLEDRELGGAHDGLATATARWVNTEGIPVVRPIWVYQPASLEQLMPVEDLKKAEEVVTHIGSLVRDEIELRKQKKAEEVAALGDPTEIWNAADKARAQMVKLDNRAQKQFKIEKAEVTALIGQRTYGTSTGDFKTQFKAEMLKRGWSHPLSGVQSAAHRPEVVEAQKKYSEAQRAYDALHYDEQLFHRRTVHAVLKEIRPVGGVALKFENPVGGLHGSQGDLSERLQERLSRIAQLFYPTDWVTASNEYDEGAGVKAKYQADRGGYNPIAREIKMGLHDPTMVHELAHRMEQVVPYIGAVEEQFHLRRTTNPDGTRMPIERMVDLHPGMNFKEDEVTIPDDFMTDYSGKIYDNAAFSAYLSHKSWELFSTGIEDLFVGGRGIYQYDKDHAHLVLGLLAAM